MFRTAAWLFYLLHFYLSHFLEINRFSKYSGLVISLGLKIARSSLPLFFSTAAEPSDSWPSNLTKKIYDKLGNKNYI